MFDIVSQRASIQSVLIQLFVFILDEGIEIIEWAEDEDVL